MVTTTCYVVVSEGDTKATEELVMEMMPLGGITKVGGKVIGKVGNGSKSGTNIKGPLKKRHSIPHVTQGGVKKYKNTVAEPWVDIKTEVEAIAQGKGTREGNIYNLGERKYELINGDHLVPHSGHGFHNLNRGEFDTLGLLNKLGDTKKTQEIAEKGIGLSQQEYQRVIEIWRKGQ